MGAGGLLYAIGEMSYAHLYGATDPFSLRWIYALYGVAYLFIGFGILLGFASLVPGWPVIGVRSRSSAPFSLRSAGSATWRASGASHLRTPSGPSSSTRSDSSSSF